jgi:GNAT superfamily N-acetyltransferase
MKKAVKQDIKVRKARASDAPRIAVLAGELGYPSTTKEIKARLGKLKPPRHAVLVAETSDGVVGWLHVTHSHLLEVPVRAEVNGLVVGGTARGQGAGKRLLEAAERWARRKGCSCISVRSNVIRERAHRFYEREGYDHYKTQKAFRKAL